MKLRFICPVCEHPERLSGGDDLRWQCPKCDHLLELDLRAVDGKLDHCAVCGNEELYKKKDFPHWLGMSILAGAALGFMALHALYLPWLAWTLLIGSAAIDGILYLSVGDVIVCYRCDAHYSGFSSGSAHPPFELIIAERYRQERIRRAQL